MSDYIKKDYSSDDIDSILEQVRDLRKTEEVETDTPSKEWSVEDIDRLIAQSNGEEYIPPKKEVLTPAEDFERILSREFDTGIFTVKPLEASPVTEMQDISSGESETEVEGQEKFFSDKPEDDFDISDFEIETVIIPEDEFNGQPEAEPEEAVQTNSDIKLFEDASESVEKIFGKKNEIEDNPHIDESEYRTRFFKKITVENTAEIDTEPTGPIEKSGILVEKGSEPSEAGLDPMPKVLAAEKAKELDDEKTRVMRTADNADFPPKSDDVDGQITLSGFDSIPEETLPEQASENDVEETLWERRRRKAASFTLSGGLDLDSEFEGEFSASPDEVAREEKARRKAARRLELEEKIESKTIGIEYTNPDERAEMHTRLTRRASKSVKSLIASGVLEIILIIVNLMPLLTEKLSIETEIFAKGSLIFYIMNAVLLIVSAVMCGKKFLGGFSDIVGGRASCDSTVSLSIAVALIQNIVVCISSHGEYFPIFTAAAGFSLLLSKAADMLDAERTLGNFEVCAFKYEHNMYAVHSLENEAEIFELGRGLMMGNADLLYSSKLAFPSDFIRNSVSEKRGSRLAGIMLPFTAAASVIVAVLAGIFTKNAVTAVSAFAGCFCICAPVFTSFIPSFIMGFTNIGLNKAGTMIVSLDEAEKIQSANAVVMDSADIFSRSQCTMHGMKDFKNIRIDDVLLYAAALVIKSGGPLRECFEQVISGRQDILPPVKELNYEDKLGISARIHNQKVLLGNRNMLIHHNIDVPDKEVEDKYAHSGRKIIYLAVAEKIAAMFVVSYAVDLSLEPYLRILESNGIQMLVRTNDVNVTEELIASSFGLPQENFRVLSSVAGKLFKRRRDAVSDKLPAGIVHDGTAYSMLRAVASSCNMTSKSKLGNVLQVIFSALGFVLSAALYCTNSADLFSGITAVVFLVAGITVSSALTFLGRTK